MDAHASAISAESLRRIDQLWAAVIQRLGQVTLGHYLLLKELGRGGMAAVLLADDIPLNRRVALKVMSPLIMTTEGMIERFRAEAITQARLTHPNIVAVHAVGREPDLHYFVMQYVAGRSLHQVLQAEKAEGRALSIDAIRSLLFQIGTALGYAHRKGVIHRDVKPGNVLLNADGDAIVTDFGIAKVVTDPSQTQTGTVVGTAAYMSPEQCYASELTPASDQYALGVVAYELITGRVPFAGSPFVMMQAHTLERLPPIVARRRDCPLDLGEAVERMLAKAPKDRFPDMDAALTALGAQAAPTRRDDPVRTDLIRLAGVAEMEALHSGAFLAPMSPPPQQRRASDAEPPRTPVSGPIVGEHAVGRASDPGTPFDSSAGGPAALRVIDPPAKVEMGERFTLTVSANDAQGAPTPVPVVRWSSTNPAIARVEPHSGEIEALSTGETDIVASVSDVVAAAHIVVVPASVGAIEARRIPVSVECGETVSVSAQAVDARGAPVDRPVTWSTRTPERASLTPAGAFTGRKEGRVVLVATSGTVKAEFEVAVVPPAVTRIELRDAPSVLGVLESMPIGVFLQDRRGFEVTRRTVEWTSSHDDVATVSAAGVVSGVSQGDAVIEARCDDAVASVAISVGPVPIAALDIKGIGAALNVESTKHVEIVARDSRGRLRDVPVEWTSTDPNVAVVDESSTLRAISVGETILTVRCGTLERSFPVEVRAALSWSAQLGAIATAASERMQEWSSGVARWVRGQSRSTRRFMIGVGAVASLALLAYVSNELMKRRIGEPNAAGGDVNVAPVATAEPKKPAVPASVVIVRPGDARLDRGGTLQLSATMSGDSVGAGDRPTWESGDPQVASVDETGLVTAVDTGDVVIAAVYGGVRDTVTLRVSEPAVEVRVALFGLDSLAVGADSSIRLSVRSARGERVRADSVRWRTSQRSIASVDAQSGRIHGLAAGRTRVAADVYLTGAPTATTASRWITVVPATVARAEPAKPVAETTNTPPPRPPLSDAVVVAAACRDAYVSLDWGRIDQLGASGTAAERESQRLFKTHQEARLRALANGDYDGPKDLGSAVTFRYPMRALWRDDHFGAKSRDEKFALQATLQAEGTRWRLAGCHIVDRPRKF